MLKWKRIGVDRIITYFLAHLLFLECARGIVTYPHLHTKHSLIRLNEKIKSNTERVRYKSLFHRDFFSYQSAAVSCAT